MKEKLKKFLIHLLRKWLDKLDKLPIENPDYKDREMRGSELIGIQRAISFEWLHKPESPYPPYNVVVRSKLLEMGVLEEIGKVMYDAGMFETDISRDEKSGIMRAIIRLYVYKRGLRKNS